MGIRLSAFGLFLVPWALLAAPGQGPQRPYLGYVYPAGGQQGTNVQVRVGGQALEGVHEVLVSGSGVSAKVLEFHRRLNFQEMRLLNEQLRALREQTVTGAAMAGLLPEDSTNAPSQTSTNTAALEEQRADAEAKRRAARKLIDKIESRTFEFEPNPASASLASIVLLEIKIAAHAEPGERELRLVTSRGVSNPLVFYVGQVPEFSREPLPITPKQVLGKEADALRNLPPAPEMRISLPCTVNGQIASGQVNRYRFEARRGQKLVMTTLGRQLVPFIADAVPGWFQPVLALYDGNGKELAYQGDYEFKPDPTLFFEVPADGDYVLEIHDSLYRGREDFVYRITVGELPFVTSIFPLGGRLGGAVKPELKGWNLDGGALTAIADAVGPGIQTVRTKRDGLVSNPIPFARDNLPEALEHEPNNTSATAQKVTLPVIINGRIDPPDDRDVFTFAGKSNQVIVAEVSARRLDSPLDSVLKLTDANGRLLAFNDDHENLTAGLKTHQADSYLMARLPADGPYYIQIADAAQHGGAEYGYRLRVSEPQPDFDLRVVPSSLSLRSRSSGLLTVYTQRRDGFAGPITLKLLNPPEGFSAAPVTLWPTQNMAQVTVRTRLLSTPEPVTLSIAGTAQIAARELTHIAVPAEDRMQAFLWRQLVPAKELCVLVFDPSYVPPARRLARARATSLTATNLTVVTNSPVGTNALAAAKPKFTQQQVQMRLRELRVLFEEGLFTDEFYQEKVAECQAGD
jgi:hypothetical protein